MVWSSKLCQGSQASSEEEVHQGVSLGMTLFSAALHPTINEIQDSHSEITLLAYRACLHGTGKLTVFHLLTPFKLSMINIVMQVV